MMKLIISLAFLLLMAHTNAFTLIPNARATFSLRSTATTFETMTVTQLKGELKARNLKVSGLKAELIERLTSQLEAVDSASAVEVAPSKRSFDLEKDDAKAWNKESSTLWSNFTKEQKNQYWAFKKKNNDKLKIRDFMRSLKR
ncbi:hypothetical protein TL16_g04191 [Triparma laevis f. inornata]|uniref:SAP domain-containing protein n=2 Tax=Triparma laevis TaxID=1534972 RepID=A0A9W7F1Z6_9STRA|nr:hypothetical protein TL16_g04191 [Triparma laevis f. inornata]GMI00174.1 hypothetical protein TrLO_g11704 [Triparma laevis f. longispina]